MADTTEVPQRRPYFWGPVSGIGLIVAVAAMAIDQASKVWLLFGFGIGTRSPVRITPFFDVVLAWNKGISYGLFQQEGAVGQWVLMGIKVAAVIMLWIWLARVKLRLTAAALGLIIGGAIGNAIDRFTYGAVADFFFFHVNTATWSFNWYVFNLADVAIVAGVAGLLYESMVGDAAKAP